MKFSHEKKVVRVVKICLYLKNDRLTLRKVKRAFLYS